MHHEYLMSRPVRGGTCPPTHPRFAPDSTCISAVANRGTVSCGYNRTRYARYIMNINESSGKWGGGGGARTYICICTYTMHTCRYINENNLLLQLNQFSLNFALEVYKYTFANAALHVRA